LEEIFFKEWPMARNQSSEFKRNLYGCCGIAYGKKSLEEIFFKEWPMARNQSSEFKRNLYSKFAEECDAVA